MRLLADENISWRLKKLLQKWEIMPANEIALTQRVSDKGIWEFAKANQYTILTFDEDFSELQNLLSFPPKIIWLRTGNVNTSEIADILIKHEQRILDFIEEAEVGIYEIYG